MSSKAVFFDIDGTLYDFRTGFGKSTAEALSRLRENGHYAFLCTGRSRASIFDPELLDLGFDGMVAGCGTYVTKEEELLLNYEIPGVSLQKMLEIFKEYRMTPVLEGEHYLYYRREDYDAGRQDEYMRTMEKLIPDRLAAIEDQEELHVNKFCVRCEEPQAAKEGLSLLEEEFTVMHLAEDFKEFVPIDYNKATGMQVLCEILGIDKNDTYAFGDSRNDVEMLKYAGCGIAMGNGSLEAKEAADYVTRGIREDGIYLGLKEFGLI